jgi:hypothetical protein
MQTYRALVLSEVKLRALEPGEKIRTTEHDHHNRPINRLRFLVDLLDLRIRQLVRIINDKEWRSRLGRWCTVRCLLCDEISVSQQQCI